MITMRQRLSLGYRMNSWLCCVSPQALHGLFPACCVPHSLNSSKTSSVSFSIHTHSPSPLPPACSSLWFPPALPNTYSASQVDSLWKWSPSRLVPSYQSGSHAALCAPVNPRPSLALGVYHTLVCLLVLSLQAVSIRQGCLLCFFVSPVSGIGRHWVALQ